MADDTPVDLQGAYRASNITQVLERLDRDLIGLVPVKNKVREQAALLLVDRLRRSLGLSAGATTLHMCFTGNPGTGKTTVAMRMAEILHGLEYLPTAQVVAVSRDDLVGQDVGQTGPRTRAAIERAKGGVLFVDEAYTLYRPEDGRDYGREAIEILMQVMENQRHELAVILAGYKAHMDVFFHSNPGMASRIAHHIEFPDYAIDELLQIARQMLDAQHYRLSPQAEAVLGEYLVRRKQMPHFANARSLRNALDRARLRQARRLLARGDLPVTRGDLMTLEAEDFLASRVFRDGVPDDQADPVAIVQTGA
jgi:probable Rubsico expression protein CbbX